MSPNHDGHHNHERQTDGRVQTDSERGFEFKFKFKFKFTGKFPGGPSESAGSSSTHIHCRPQPPQPPQPPPLSH
jgi:hypothetical protein